MMMVMGAESPNLPQSSEFEFDFDFLNFRELDHDEAPVSPRLICPVSPWRSTPTSPAPTQNPTFVSEPRNPSFGSELRNPSFRAGSRDLNFKPLCRNVSFGSESRNPNSTISASAWSLEEEELVTSSVRQLLEEDMRSSSSRDSKHREEGGENSDGFVFYSGPAHHVAIDQKEAAVSSASSSSAASLSSSSSSSSASASASASLLGLQEGRRKSVDIITASGSASGLGLGSASGLSFGSVSGSVARRTSLPNLHHESSRASAGPLIHTKKSSASASGSSSSSPSIGKLWAFKDFLRRTVPSSKYEAGHPDTASRPPRRCLGESKTAPGTPRSSRPTSPRTQKKTPLLPNNPYQSLLPNNTAQHQHQHQAVVAVSKRKAHVSAIEVPTPGPYKMLASPTSASPRTPKSSKVPMSPHALHYTQQRAQAAHLRRKTNLPYRYNLLGGCLGNAFMSEREANLVW